MSEAPYREVRGRAKGDIIRAQMLRWIHEMIFSNGWPPTVRDVCQQFGWSSPSTAHFHLMKLEQEGLIERNQSRKILRVTEEGRRQLQ